MPYIASHHDNCNLHFVPYRPKEWLEATLDLSWEQKAVYHEAFMLICLRRGPIRFELLQKSLGMHWRTLKSLLGQLYDKGKLVLSGDEIDHRLAAKEVQETLKKVSRLVQDGAKGGKNKHLSLAKGGETQIQIIDTEEASASSGVGEPPPQPPLDPMKEFWNLGAQILGSREILGHFRKEYGEPACKHATERCLAVHPSEPVKFFRGCCKDYTQRIRLKAAQRPLSPATKMAKGYYDGTLEYYGISKEGLGDISTDHWPHVALLDG